MDMSKTRKAKRDGDFEKETTIISGSTSSTEEMDVAGYDEWELIVREETKEWLDLHGAKLFALEASKYFAAEAKKKNLRGLR